MRRPALAPFAVAALLALTGCSADADGLRTAEPDATSTAGLPRAGELTAVPDPASPAPSSLPPAPSSAPGAPTLRGAAPAPTGTGADGSAAAPGRVATTAPGAPVAPRAAAEPTSVQPSGTVPGDYLYDASGSFSTAGTAPRRSSGTATLSVAPPSGGRQLLVLDGEQGRTETDVALRADGRYLVRLTLTMPGFSEEFRPAEPVLLLPIPLVTGQRWQWTARSADGSTTVTARSRVTGDRTQAVGGEEVPTAVVETALTVRGDVVFDGTTTTDYEPDRGLPVRESGSGRGTVQGVSFTTENASALRSLDPR